MACDKWVEWYYGTTRFDIDGVGIAATIMTINTQTIDHYIKMFAGNMNVDKSQMDVLAMKNEFFWNVFIVTNVSKHYFANILIQEGNVLPKQELEKKGVHLIASKYSKDIREYGTSMMLDILDKVGKNEKVSYLDYAKGVADIERNIINDIKSGSIDIYSLEKIKEEKAYKKEAKMSPYLHHLLWKEVFADKYGDSDNPQYMVLKIPTTLHNNHKMVEYLDAMEDTDISNKLGNFLKKYGKEQIGTFRVPVTIAADKGVPIELLDALDTNRLITTSCSMLYIVLETLGLYRKDNLLLSEMGY
jgi:hypothetical protein